MLVTRSGKGSKLTTQEMDNNLLYLEQLSAGLSASGGPQGPIGPQGPAGSGSGGTVSINTNEIVFGSTTGLTSSSDFTFDDSTKSSILGGRSNGLTSSNYSSILTGQSNNIGSSCQSTIIGGLYNNVTNTSDSSSIISGQSNNIESSCQSAILGGQSNNLKNCSSFSTILGGKNIDISQSRYSSIVSGHYNTQCSSDFSSIISGDGNSIYSSNRSSILGGSTNGVTASSFSSIIGGYSNNIKNSNNSIILGGENLILDNENNKVLVPSLKIATASNDNSLTDILAKDSQGNVKYINKSSIGGLTSSAGTNRMIQFNDNGVLGASASLTFNTPGALYQNELKLKSPGTSSSIGLLGMKSTDEPAFTIGYGESSNTGSLFFNNVNLSISNAGPSPATAKYNIGVLSQRSILGANGGDIFLKTGSGASSGELLFTVGAGSGGVGGTEVFRMNDTTASSKISATAGMVLKYDGGQLVYSTLSNKFEMDLYGATCVGKNLMVSNSMTASTTYIFEVNTPGVLATDVVYGNISPIVHDALDLMDTNIVSNVWVDRNDYCRVSLVCSSDFTLLPMSYIRIVKV
jgi:hypothetical protein